MRWGPLTPIVVQPIWELLLTWRTSSLIAKLCKGQEKEYFSIFVCGELTVGFPVALLAHQTGCTCMVSRSRWEVQVLAPIHDRLRSPRERGLTWQLTWANCELLLFATSSHMFLSFPLHLCDLMWRKKKKNHLIFIWLSSWINTCKIKVSRCHIVCFFVNFWYFWGGLILSCCLLCVCNWSFTCSFVPYKGDCWNGEGFACPASPSPVSLTKTEQYNTAVSRCNLS